MHRSDRRRAMRTPRHRMIIGVTLAAGVAMAVAALPAESTDAAGANNCPDAFPSGQLTPGQEVTGLTVSSGTTPDTITGQYVGSIDDGIAPGVDMLVFRLQGSKITTPSGDVDRGIWAGMSGSPLYTQDGRLIGAVSYGLSLEPSDYAGVTPAAAMYALSKYSRPAPKSVAVPHHLAAMLRHAGAPAKQASQGMHQLRMPLNINASGSMKRVRRIADHTGHSSIDLRRSGSSVGADTKPVPILPGGNLADSISYGEITEGSIGTATAVCGGQVFGFGHPDGFTGKTSMTMHGADALYIQKDLTGSFKVANLSAPEGTISQDRLAGIFGNVGALPPRTKITVSSTAPYNHHTGTSYNSLGDYLSMTVAEQVMADGDVANDRIGEGRAAMSWTMRVQPKKGKALTYRRTDVFSARHDITGLIPYEIASDVDTLLDNPFEPVRITSVGVHTTLTPHYTSYAVKRLEYRLHDHWRTATSKSVVARRAGHTFRVRVTLAPKAHSSGSTHRFIQRVHVPKSARGTTGTVVVRGHKKAWWAYGTGTRATSSVGALIKAMQGAPRGDTVSVGFTIGTSAHSARHTAPSIVTGVERLKIRAVK